MYSLRLTECCITKHNWKSPPNTTLTLPRDSSRRRHTTRIFVIFYVHALARLKANQCFRALTMAFVQCVNQTARTAWWADLIKYPGIGVEAKWPAERTKAAAKIRFVQEEMWGQGWIRAKFRKVTSTEWQGTPNWTRRNDGKTKCFIQNLHTWLSRFQTPCETNCKINRIMNT